MDVINEVKKIEKDIISWRRDLHKIPEYNFELSKTSEYIQNKLREFNIEHRVVAKTGIIATIYGKNDGLTIGIRADMDALAIKEETNLPFKSENDGYMHACGHDAHVSILLGAAKILAENKDKINGNVRLIFQPAEETTGGAKIMIEEGCLENPKVDMIIALHVGSSFKEVKNGQIGIRRGPMFASCDSFLIKVKGKGGHAAHPNICVDPILISAEMITSLQKIVSRELNPLHARVITVGMIKGGTDFNIIPEDVMFKGTIRLLDKNDRDFVGERIKTIISNIAEANRATVEIDYNQYYPAVINDDNITSKLIESVKKVLDEEKIVDIKEPVLGAEDASYYLNEIPGTYFMLGSVKEHDDGNVYPHHHPKFNIDETVLWMGTAAFVQFVCDNLI